MKQSNLVGKGDFYELVGTDNLANIVTLDRREDRDIVLRFRMGDVPKSYFRQVRLNTKLARELRKMLNDELDETIWGEG